MGILWYGLGYGGGYFGVFYEGNGLELRRGVVVSCWCEEGVERFEGVCLLVYVSDFWMV